MAAEIKVQAAFEGEIGLGERDVWPVLRLSACTRLPKAVPTTGRCAGCFLGKTDVFWR